MLLTSCICDCVLCQMFQWLRPPSSGLGGQQLPRRGERPLKRLFHLRLSPQWTPLLTILAFQTKDKMCDIADTTHLYPFTTTVAAKTTSRSKEATAGRDAASTSHPPTSVPTEGKVAGAGTRPRCLLCVSPGLLFNSWWMLCSGEDVK